ncbi:KilA-N domain-containing protein [Paraburkholderia sp. JHI2823]|uniref:KilA-N domain-containing protein n=1 Tax=Paraburkholderia sp. JHI2823 TaxID=3112960 RepID=UPI00316BC477
MNDFVVCGVEIRRDAMGRYSLNDLHRAAGGADKHSPNRWTRTKGYADLISELTPELAFAPAESIRGGSAPGTYAVKEMVYAYAMWISASLYLMAIRTSAGWQVADHACRFCFGRVLQRVHKCEVVEVRCANCGKRADGPPKILCCCSADCGDLGHALECFKNPEVTNEVPHEILVRERRGDAAE